MKEKFSDLQRLVSVHADWGSSIYSRQSQRKETQA